MSRKVKCKVCGNLNSLSKCIIKKSTMKSTKRRHCANFQLDPEKVVIRPKPKSRYSPIWEWDSKVRKRMLKQLEEQQEAAAQTVAKEQATVASRPSYLDTVSKGPDCLAGIRSSVGDGDGTSSGL